MKNKQENEQEVYAFYVYVHTYFNAYFALTRCKYGDDQPGKKRQDAITRQQNLWKELEDA